MGFPWFSYGFPMVFLWNHHFPMVFSYVTIITVPKCAKDSQFRQSLIPPGYPAPLDFLPGDHATHQPADERSGLLKQALRWAFSGFYVGFLYGVHVGLLWFYLVFLWFLAVEPGFKGRPWSRYRGWMRYGGCPYARPAPLFFLNGQYWYGHSSHA